MGDSVFDFFNKVGFEGEKGKVYSMIDVSRG